MFDRLASWESRLRPFLVRLPAPVAVRLYSTSRRRFIEALVRRPPTSWRSGAHSELARDLWGIRFRSPLFGAAGLYKTGRGYRLVDRQGAGAFLAGTVTSNPRLGNQRSGVFQPFAPYPTSKAASNWLGLPNPGHEAVQHRLKQVERSEGCPIGVSVAALADCDGDLERLTAALRRYEEVGVDFLELNESCPNTEQQADGGDESLPSSLTNLRGRLEVIRDLYLDRRQRHVPVIVKFSCDADPSTVESLVALLVDLGFDGVNFGNTSIAYDRHRASIAPDDRPLFDYFSRTFGGGLSGQLLRRDSAKLSAAASTVLSETSVDHEFHVVRTGGVENAADLAESFAAGVSLCQWYTGYFEGFSRFGHDLYRHTLDEYQRLCRPT